MERAKALYGAMVAVNEPEALTVIRAESPHLPSTIRPAMALQ